jgi:glyoxylase-like metal-dependent hydrolase (beta-lactamase superfamily II)
VVWAQKLVTELGDSIQYEYDFQPAVGEVVDILPGVKWVRLPLPFMLSHINTWLLEDGDGRAMVDTGLGTRTTREAWDSIFSSEPGLDSISRVLVTHLHPDHVGCAGWLCERFNVDLYMPRDEGGYRSAGTRGG